MASTSKFAFWMFTRMAAYCALALLLCGWLALSKELAKVAASIVAVITGVPPGPMSANDALICGVVAGVTITALMIFGFWVCRLAFRWVTEVTQKKMMGEDSESKNPNSTPKSSDL
jgi:hypothetical protein